MNTRRDFLKLCGLGLAGAALPWPLRTRSLRATALPAPLPIAKSKQLDVVSVDRVTLRLPYRPAPQRAMDRELPHWRYTEVFTVKLRSGHEGIGETLLYYTWGVSDDADAKRAIGANAADLLWDDSLGAGLQMALFDAVGRALDVPIHRLLGRQVHEATPLSWWNIDMAVDDMADECAEAYKQGYLSYKTKGRPWFDIWKQVDTAAKRVPESFKIDMDFNDTLLNADKGIPILKDLEAYPEIDIYESPIPQRDIEGNRRIREATRVQIAMHYGTPRPAVVVKEGVCDGFVVGGGAQRVLNQGAFCEEVGMPFWLQLVGSDITAAYSLHFGAVLKQARWPAVNCHQLYRDRLLTKPIVVERGFSKIPNGPGLGFELDRKQIERLRVDKPKERPNPDRLLEVSWPDGKRLLVASAEVNFILHKGIRGEIPFYKRGVDTKLLSDDGTAAWRRDFERAKKGAFYK